MKILTFANMEVRAYPLGDLPHRKQEEMAFRPSRMRTRRTELGLSQPDLAKLIKTTQPRISYWEKGKEKPTFDYLARLAKALECSADYLLGLSDDPLGYLRESDLSPEERAVIAAIREGRSVDEIDALALRASKAQAAKNRKLRGKR